MREAILRSHTTVLLGQGWERSNQRSRSWCANGCGSAAARRATIALDAFSDRELASVMEQCGFDEIRVTASIYCNAGLLKRRMLRRWAWSAEMELFEVRG